MHRILLLIASALLVIGLVACESETPTSPTSLTPTATSLALNAVSPNVVPPTANVLGKSYAEWSADWWRWLWSSTPATNPGFDETGELVDFNQSGNVWFLAPNFGGVTVRNATIPTGKFLFTDVAAWFFAPQIGDPEDETALRAAAAAAADATMNVRFEVDGVAVPNMDDFRVQSDLFDYTLPEDNMFTFFGFPSAAGNYYPAVSDGWFVMIPPLSKGEHTIRMYAELPFYGVSDVTVNLTVAPGRNGKIKMAD